jgi:hypothetical protein
MSFNDSNLDAKQAKVTTFTGNGSWTPDADVKYIVAEIQGAGGGSGGALLVGVGLSSASAGGGGGAYLKVLVTRAQLTASAQALGARTVTIGASGTAAGAGGNGGTGGTSTLQGIGSAAGGNGGSVGTVLPTSNGAVANGPTGGVSTAPIIGTQLIGRNGEAGGCAYVTPQQQSYIEEGASSPMGIGGVGTAANGAFASVAGTGFGAAATGATSIGPLAARTGVAGNPGVIVITEFFA